MRSRSPSLRAVIYVLIPLAWLAVVFLGLTMCRVGALSDRLHASALAEWVASTPHAERETFSLETLADQRPYRNRRATG
jgi:hypothetical protein